MAAVTSGYPQPELIPERNAAKLAVKVGGDGEGGGIGGVKKVEAMYLNACSDSEIN